MRIAFLVPQYLPSAYSHCPCPLCSTQPLTIRFGRDLRGGATTYHILMHYGGGFRGGDDDVLKGTKHRGFN